MLFYKYDSEILPKITLLGKSHHAITTFTSNIRRISEDYIFYIITDGELYFNEDGKDYCLKKGDCFLFEPGKLHYGTKKSYYNFMFIHFRHSKIEQFDLNDDKMLVKVERDHKNWSTTVVGGFHANGNLVLENGVPPETSIIIPKMVSFGDAAEFSTVRALLDKAIDQYKIRYENYNTISSCAVSELFIVIYRYLVSVTLKNAGYGSTAMKRMDSVVSYLNLNFAKELTSEIIEKELSYNFDYLNQLFRKHLNTTIFQMLTDIRITVAKNLMKTSNFSLKTIAEQVGFKDQSYFSKTFKKHTGYTPKQYILNMQKQGFKVKDGNL